MKIISTILLSFLALSSYAEAPDEFEVNFVKNFLRSYAPGYPERRKEAFRMMNSVRHDAKQEIYQTILDNDLTFMSYTNSFEDLWKLRYNNKWEPKVLYSVARTACFYVKYCSEHLKTGSSRDLGIINEIMNDLRNIPTPQANRLLIKLVAELHKLQEIGMAKLSVTKMDEGQKTFNKALIQAMHAGLVKMNRKRIQGYLESAYEESSIGLKSTNRTTQDRDF